MPRIFRFNTEEDMIAVSNDQITNAQRYLPRLNNKNVGTMYLDDLNDLRNSIDDYSKFNPSCKMCYKIKSKIGGLIMSYNKRLSELFQRDPIEPKPEILVSGFDVYSVGGKVRYFKRRNTKRRHTKKYNKKGRHIKRRHTKRYKK